VNDENSDRPVFAPEEENMPDADPPFESPTKDQLKAALKAFKKRLKLTQLDHDSKLGRSPMTSGRRADIVAIVPPSQYPAAVWDELVKQGKLKKAGHGTYELVPE
jgi:hypothetical protein